MHRSNAASLPFRPTSQAVTGLEDAGKPGQGPLSIIATLPDTPHLHQPFILTTSPTPTASPLELIQPDMLRVDQVISERLTTEVPLVREVAQYIISAGGKRLRPALLLLVSGEEFEGVVVDSISTAQHAGQRYDSHVPTLRTQRLEQSSCSRNKRLCSPLP